MIPTEVTKFWKALQKKHPKAKIMASSIDAFAADVRAGDYSKLPVVTHELGDRPTPPESKPKPSLIQPPS